MCVLLDFRIFNKCINIRSPVITILTLTRRAIQSFYRILPQPSCFKNWNRVYAVSYSVNMRVKDVTIPTLVTIPTVVTDLFIILV